MRIILSVACGLLSTLLLVFLLAPASALASGPARTETVAAGAYVIDVQFSQDPPFTDQPLTITVVPHDTHMQLSGQIIAQPGLGTDAVDIHTSLSSTGGSANTLQGTIHIPVRGAWQIKIHLDGPNGAGEAKIPTVVGAPGAMPPWLAWLIGSFPLVFIVFWILHQHRYRNTLKNVQQQRA